MKQKLLLVIPLFIVALGAFWYILENKPQYIPADRSPELQEAGSPVREFELTKMLEGEDIRKEFEKIQKREALASHDTRSIAPIVYVASMANPVDKGTTTSTAQHFSLDTDVITADYTLESEDSMAAAYTFSRDGAAFFGAQLCHKDERNLPVSMTKVLDAVAISLYRGPCVPTAVQKDGNAYTYFVGKKDVQYKGNSISSQFGVDEAAQVFEYNAKLGFLGKKDGTWALYYDGKKVSPEYDGIGNSRAQFFDVFENGSVAFLAEHAGKQYLVEIAL